MAGIASALVLAMATLGASTASSGARTDVIFTVTAPARTYTASTAEHAQLARAASRSGMTRRQAR
jgi:hypothetical protein